MKAQVNFHNGQTCVIDSLHAPSYLSYAFSTYRRIPCLKRSACRCMGNKDRHIHSFHAHNYPQHHYHSYNTYQHTGNPLTTTTRRLRSPRRPSSVVTEHTAMTHDNLKVRSTSSRGSGLSIYLKGQGHQIQAIPLVPVGADALVTENNSTSVARKTTNHTEVKLSDAKCSLNGSVFEIGDSSQESLMNQHVKEILKTDGADRAEDNDALVMRHLHAACVDVEGGCAAGLDKLQDLMQV